MNDEIERLRFEHKATLDALDAAKKAEDAALRALNLAVIDWAKADLTERGIIVMETPVIALRLTHDKKPFQAERGEGVVFDVAAARGAPMYRLKRLTKGGKISKGYDADMGAFPMVQKVQP